MQQTRVFWLIYIFEKGLSLRLGRSSTLRDSDITIPVPDMGSTSEIAYFGRLKKMVDLARLQGKIYDQLYSPAALIEPQASRTARAKSLASELEAHTTSIEENEVCLYPVSLIAVRWFCQTKAVLGALSDLHVHR